jgi:hypothetical protein
LQEGINEFRLVEVVDHDCRTPVVTIRSRSQKDFNFFFFSKIASFATGSSDLPTGSEAFPDEKKPESFETSFDVEMVVPFYQTLPLKSKHSGVMVKNFHKSNQIN